MLQSVIWLLATLKVTHSVFCMVSAKLPLPPPLPSSDPTECPAVPTADVGNGTWPQNCKGMAIGLQCQATCGEGFTGSPKVVCQKTGQWDAVATETCKGAWCRKAYLLTYLQVTGSGHRVHAA
jgi:hypothetical protein